MKFEMSEPWLLIVESCGSGKKKSLFNLINQQPDIGKINLYVKDLMKQNINC